MEIYIKAITDFSEEEYKKYFEMMSEERKKAVLRLRFEGDRYRSVIGESLARQGISKETGIEEADILFGREEYGKPFCKNADIHFSISHSKEAVVCAVSDRKIGADIEKMRNLETRIARISCTDSDLEFIFGSATIPESFNNESLFRFFRLWTAKEAYFKYCGTGIVKLKDISFKDIKDKCQMQVHGDYMITIYED